MGFFCAFYFELLGPGETDVSGKGVRLARGQNAGFGDKIK
jgi:hypothetical protein